MRGSSIKMGTSCVQFGSKKARPLPYWIVLQKYFGPVHVRECRNRFLPVGARGQ